MVPIERISAVTLACTEMDRSVAFYRALGFGVLAGGPGTAFTTLDAGQGGFLNLQLVAGWRGGPAVWGRVIFWVHDVDAMHRRALDAGLRPEMSPADAAWGERYFHLRDPDGHELSFARPLDR